MHNFSFNHYRDIMKSINNNGYKAVTFYEEYDSKQVLVRHDVDIDLDAALEMAKIENEENIRATYYIWINSPFYNVFEKRYSNIIREILSLGHDIGLHFDETAYEISCEEDILKLIEKECEVLNLYFQIDIKSVSFHRPSKYVLENDLELGKYVNTYSKKFFKEYKYISDSNGIWREGCACNLFNENKEERVQLLTHPIWWKEKHVDGDVRLTNYLQFKIEKLENDLSSNIKRYEIKNYSII